MFSLCLDFREFVNNVAIVFEINDTRFNIEILWEIIYRRYIFIVRRLRNDLFIESSAAVVIFGIRVPIYLLLCITSTTVLTGYYSVTCLKYIKTVDESRLIVLYLFSYVCE